MMSNEGKIIQVIGPVVDIRFDQGELPNLNNAIKVLKEDGSHIIVEVAQHTGDDTVRCVGYSGYYRWMVWESFGESEQYLTYIQYPCTPYRRARKIPMSALAAIMSAAEERVRGFRYV